MTQNDLLLCISVVQWNIDMIIDRMSMFEKGGIYEPSSGASGEFCTTKFT